jgi:hypothetical protein
VSRDVTGSIKVLGTPAYMAPERFGGTFPRGPHSTSAVRGCE